VKKGAVPTDFTFYTSTLHSIRDILTLANFNAIFILFLGLFPSHLSHHTEPYCLVNYTNKPLSANEKEIILKEMKHSGISRNKRAEYLNVNPHRIEKMVASKKSGAMFYRYRWSTHESSHYW
jgi:hypothetical protein